MEIGYISFKKRAELAKSGRKEHLKMRVILDSLQFHNENYSEFTWDDMYEDTWGDADNWGIYSATHPIIVKRITDYERLKELNAEFRKDGSKFNIFTEEDIREHGFSEHDGVLDVLVAEDGAQPGSIKAVLSATRGLYMPDDSPDEKLVMYFVEFSGIYEKSGEEGYGYSIALAEHYIYMIKKDIEQYAAKLSEIYAIELSVWINGGAATQMELKAMQSVVTDIDVYCYSYELNNIDINDGIDDCTEHTYVT